MFSWAMEIANSFSVFIPFPLHFIAFWISFLCS